MGKKNSIKNLKFKADQGMTDEIWKIKAGKEKKFCSG